MAKSSPAHDLARHYADRLILEKLTELHEVVKPSEISDLLTPQGLGLAAVRSLLSSNPERFAYHERRWIPAARLTSEGRPMVEAIRLMVQGFGAPMPLNLVVAELSRNMERDEDWMESAVRRAAHTAPAIFITRDDRVGLRDYVFAAYDEAFSRALALNFVDESDVVEVESKLGDFDWQHEDAIVLALEKCAPVSIKALGAAAYRVLSPDDPRLPVFYNWKAFNGELLSVPGFVAGSDGVLYPEAEAKKWVSAAVNLADKLKPTIEVEDATPLELKKDDLEACIQQIIASDASVSAIKLLEERFEVTPTVKTFPDDLNNIITALRSDDRVWFVGGDRFRKPKSAPDFIYEAPEAFQFVKSDHLQDDGEPVDVELVDDGLNTSLRKLIIHPLAMDVMDEEILPAPKNTAETLRLVMRPIHRELGTFPLSQIPTGWLDSTPTIQELILVNPDGQELQVWMNTEARLMFNLFDWWLDQPVESGAVFSLTKTNRPNVLEFAWLDQTDPVVYVSNQRMEELREIAGESEGQSTFDVLRRVMEHWPKGADFLTVLWEINVVRRTSRRLLASLLSSYTCFYQRSGSPVWHYDAKKVEQGFDKSKKRFIKKD